jgi:hypothetical protein
MKRPSVLLLVSLGALTGLAMVVLAATGFEVLSGKTFDQAVITNFYLEGQAIPAQKRNAILFKTPAGARVLVALLDTSGYGADITQKYHGMIINEGPLTIAGKALQPGSYGFGLTLMNPSGPPSGSKGFYVYTQGGHKIMESKAMRDDLMSRAKPIQVLPRKDNVARLYVGRDWVELK